MYLLNSTNILINGITAAKFYKYYKQFKNTYIENPIQFKQITANSIYNKYSSSFDKLAKISIKYKFSLQKYIQYIVNKYDIQDKYLNRYLLNIKLIEEYITYEIIKCNRKKIFKYFQKTVNNIVNDCILYGYISSIDYIRELIKTKKLAQYYISGKISKYYLAAIPKFKDIVLKLDSISQDEFLPICNKYEKYNIDVKEAMKQELSKIVSIFDYTDNLIYQKRIKMQI